MLWMLWIISREMCVFVVIELLLCFVFKVGTFTLSVLVLDVGLYFTLEHYLQCVCARLRACTCAHRCGCGCGCCFGGADGCIPLTMLVNVCQSCCLLMFVCLPLSRHLPCCKTWWIKNLNLNLNKIFFLLFYFHPMSHCSGQCQQPNNADINW